MENLIFMPINIIVQGLITFAFMYLFLRTNKKYTKKQYIILLISLIAIVGIGNGLRSLFTMANTLGILILQVLVLTFVMKVKALKSLLLSLLNITFFIVGEGLAVALLQFILQKSFATLMSNVLNYALLLLLQMIINIIMLLLIYYILKKKSNIIDYFKSITPKQVKFLIATIALYLLPQTILFATSYYSYSFAFLMINTIQFVCISIFLFMYTKKDLENTKAQSELFTSEIHNKTLIGMVDGVRTLKHDYNNIIQALNGYVTTKQYDKLCDHIDALLKECNVINSLASIDPETFNEPAIYGIVGSKYFLANKDDIAFDTDVMVDLSKIQFPMPDLSRIFGILLDNSIEATRLAKNPYVRLEMRFDKRKNADIIRIINSYDTSINIDINDIYKKGVSSKKVKSGIGLWEVKNLVKKQKHSQIFATIEKDKFVQNIIIERSDVN